MNYYNEIDPYCAAWLQNLMDAGHIAPGVIDTRSIEDVTPAELAGYTQCHFFAGLGGWAHALDLAGWPRDRPVWTGSCPCQPFSAAGKGAGFADERHLWPAWQHLIAQCRPAVVFGEQVACKAVDSWIDLVHADLESMGYAFGCVPFPSAGVGAPHIRDRAYWVADAERRGSRCQAARADHQRPKANGPADQRGGCGSSPVRMADADGRNASAERQQRGGEQRQQPQDGGAGGLANAYSAGLQQRDGNVSSAGHWHTAAATRGDARHESAGPTNGLWRDADWLRCTDGKFRPVEPGTFPLAHGLPNRVGRLRAYGNAINAEQAAEFIRSYAEARGLIGLEAAA